MNRPFEPLQPDSGDELKRQWQAQPVPASDFSVEELRHAASRFHRQIARRNAVELAACALVVLVFAFYLVKLPLPPLMRVGSALMIGGILVVAWQLRSRASARPGLANLGEQSWIDYHRAQLIRQRDALRSVATWYIGPLVPGFAVFGWGVATELGPQALLSSVLWGLLAMAGGILVIALNRHAARKLQRRIDSLNQESR